MIFMDKVRGAIRVLGQQRAAQVDITGDPAELMIGIIKRALCQVDLRVYPPVQVVQVICWSSAALRPLYSAAAVIIHVAGRGRGASAQCAVDRSCGSGIP